MKSLTKTALFVIFVTIFGVLFSFILFDLKPTPASVLGNFLMPVISVLLISVFSKPKLSTQE